jgi:hypothetical protein
VPYGTVRNILRRNKHRLTHPAAKRRRREKREFVDWYSAKPFEIVQADLKYIRDHEALTKEQIIHLDRCGIPNFQWGALDVNSRFKIIAYSRERSWTNGLCFYLWVVSWLRSHGITARIVFTVDNGEEFGGQSPVKIRELRKLLSGFGCRVIQNRKGHPEDNAHLERSHLTDDDEFYRVRALAIHSEQELLDEATGYIYYYNNVRDHYSLNDQPPFTHLKQQQPDLDDTIRYVQPFMLDDVSVALGPWSGYNVLAQHPIDAPRLDHDYQYRQVAWLIKLPAPTISTVSHPQVLGAPRTHPLFQPRELLPDPQPLHRHLDCTPNAPHGPHQMLPIPLAR